VHPLTHYLKFHVLRYNARGVGRSSGWKSFSGLQEGQDLRELVQYALKRLGGDDVRQVAFIVRVLPPPPPVCPPRDRACF
jgi:alpha/beta superfamily hydrolase